LGLTYLTHRRVILVSMANPNKQICKFFQFVAPDGIVSSQPAVQGRIAEADFGGRGLNAGLTDWLVQKPPQFVAPVVAGNLFHKI
jgi:hypothetical protein